MGYIRSSLGDAHENDRGGDTADSEQTTLRCLADPSIYRALNELLTLHGGSTAVIELKTTIHDKGADGSSKPEASSRSFPCEPAVDGAASNRADVAIAEEAPSPQTMSGEKQPRDAPVLAAESPSEKAASQPLDAKEAARAERMFRSDVPLCRLVA